MCAAHYAMRQTCSLLPLQQESSVCASEKTHTHTHRYGRRVQRSVHYYAVAGTAKRKGKNPENYTYWGKIIIIIIIKISVAHNESRRVIAIRSPGQLGVFSPYEVDDLSSPGFFFTVIRLLLVLIVLFPLPPHDSQTR